MHNGMRELAAGASAGCVQQQSLHPQSVPRVYQHLLPADAVHHPAGWSGSIVFERAGGSRAGRVRCQHDGQPGSGPVLLSERAVAMSVQQFVHKLYV